MSLEEKVKIGLLRSGIQDKIKEIIVNDPGLQGEGFASQARYIKVVFENPDKAPKNLFAKIVTPNESHTQMLDEMKAFVKEATFLTSYVATADDLCRKHGCQLASSLFPKCYYGDSRAIIMENLVLDGGYCLIDKSERQDLDAAKLAIQTLAKHQAISHAVIEDMDGPTNFFKRFPYLDFESFDKPMFRSMMGPAFANALRSNVKLLESNSVEGHGEALKVLKPFLDVSVIDLVLGALKQDEGELSVLNHGDYWNNNMMFLKNEDNKVIGHKAIDLQVTRYNSPVLDVVYFLYTSVKTEVRIAHLEELLRTYLSTLTEMSAKLGHRISLTYETLWETFRSKLNYGYWFSMCMVIGPGMQAMKEMDIASVDMKDFAVVMDGLIQKWMANNPEYSQVIAKELVELAKEYQRLSVA